MDVYEITKSIGSGNFGQVFLARHKFENKDYVVKKIKIRELSEKDQEATEQEVRLLQSLRHPNIVAYKDSYTDRDHYLCIVMMYCEGGDMYSKITSAKGKKFSESQILDWVAQVIMALLFMHERKILHRDLKTHNIFLRGNQLKLGDFGIAKVLDDTRDFANTCIGTPYYMSPELFNNRPYSYKSDIWSLGCVIYEMCNLRHAFDAQSINGLAVKILKGSFPPLSPYYSKGLRDLVTKMLSTTPSRRPSLKDIVQHPLIRRHIVLYLRSAFASDDPHTESLRDQAERYGFMPAVTGEPKAPPKQVQQIQAKIQVEEGEKAEFEQELKNVRDRKNSLKQQLGRAEELELQHKQKQIDAEKRREKLIDDRRKKAQAMRKAPGEDSEDTEEVSAKDRVLMKKLQEKKESEDKERERLRKIHMDNHQSRQSAYAKQKAQFRPSGNEGEEKLAQLEELELKEQSIEEMVQAKTVSIEKLRESLQFPESADLVINIPEEAEDEIDDEETLESVQEEEEEEEENSSLPSWQTKLRDRMNLLKQCKAAIGIQIYERTYLLLKQLSGISSQQVRKDLIEVLGEKNIGYWAMFDQILFIENSMT